FAAALALHLLVPRRQGDDFVKHAHSVGVNLVFTLLVGANLVFARLFVGANLVFALLFVEANLVFARLLPALQGEHKVRPSAVTLTPAPFSNVTPRVCSTCSRFCN